MDQIWKYTDDTAKSTKMSSLGNWVKFRYFMQWKCAYVPVFNPQTGTGWHDLKFQRTYNFIGKN